MSRFTRIEVFSEMARTGIVPLFYHADPAVCKDVVTACYEGGARVLEFTSRGDHAIDVFRELDHFCRQELPEMILGVGSVTDGAMASLYMHVGANFIVTPVLREDIVTVCNRRKVLWSPGCGSLTEIARAEELGCELVKLFPGGTYGPKFIKGIKGPCPWTNVMPTGGVAPEEENLRAWHNAGATCVGMGSQLITKEIVQNQNYEQLRKMVSDCLAMWKSFG